MDQRPQERRETATTGTKQRLSAEERARLYAGVRSILGPATDLQAMARALDAAGAAIDGRAWVHSVGIDAKQAEELLVLLIGATAAVPDVSLLSGEAGSAQYMNRWWLDRELVGSGPKGQYGLYLHVFHNDDPEALHTHPWASAALVLAGVLDDNGPHCSHRVRSQGLILRPAGSRHQITLPAEPPDSLDRLWKEHGGGGATPRAMTLIATGRRKQEGWGFVRKDGRVEKVDDKKRSEGSPMPRGSRKTTGKDAKR